MTNSIINDAKLELVEILEEGEMTVHLGYKLNYVKGIDKDGNTALTGDHKGIKCKLTFRPDELEIIGEDNRWWNLVSSGIGYAIRNQLKKEKANEPI